MANFNYTKLSNLDIYVVVNLDGINATNSENITSKINHLRFIWNLDNGISVRGYDVELFLVDDKNPHIESGLFSLSDNKWIKRPEYDSPAIDDLDIEKKIECIKYEIDQLQIRLISLKTLPSNAKALYQRAKKIKENITKMKKESALSGGDFSMGNIIFKKLRNEGYIEKLIGLISNAYDKIYNEK
jgi:hypothetical protein